MLTPRRRVQCWTTANSSAALNFILIAFVLFIVIRAMNNLKRKEDAKVDVPEAPEIPADVKLLAEIRDQLALLNSSLTP